MSRTWSDKKECKRLAFQLAVYTDHDAFVRRLLPLLRLRFPDLAPAAPSLDLVAPGVAVRCLLFATPELDSAPQPTDQALRAIDDLRALDLRGATLWLLHNQDARSRGFHAAIQAALDRLQQERGLAAARLLCRQALLHEVFEAMLGHLRAAIAGRSAAFAVPADLMPLTSVPLQQGSLRIDANRLLEAPRLDPPALADPAALLLGGAGGTSRGPSGNVTMLIGEAGFGKTTAALRALRPPAPERGAPRCVLYVPGAQITPVLCSKDLLLQCLDEIPALCQASAEERPDLESIARPTFEYLLKQHDAGVAIVLDGLDESFYLTRRGGLQILMNLLREVQVPVVLIARKEYWYARLGDFATQFGAVARDSRRPRSVRLLELLPWDDAQIAELARRFAATLCDPDQRARLQRFLRSIEEGEYQRFYGDIPRRPLFLRFILETVAQHDVHQVGRARLFAEWVYLKILRDSGSGRAPILSESEGGDATAALALRAMERAAWHMTREQDGELLLLGSCPLAPVLAEDAQLQGVVDATGLWLNSLLLPTAPPTPLAPLCVRFAHRAYQEFFLARHLHQHPPPPALVLPAAIKDWLQELASAAGPAVAAAPAAAPAPAALLPAPPGARWEDLLLTAVDGDRLRARLRGGPTRTFTYQQLGMASAQNGSRTRAFEILEELCANGRYRASRPYDADKTQISGLRAALRRIFAIPGDPLLRFVPPDRAGEGGEWRPRFRVGEE